MAATDPKSSQRTESLGGILLAALALPGLMPALASAENAPEHTTLAFKNLYYHDYQSDLERITVIAPSLYAEVPLSPSWAVDASTVVDSVSGASPRYYTAKSGASKMTDTRKAGDVKFTHYASRSALGAGLSYSKEDDYESRGLSADGRWSTADNNTTFNAGLAYLDDRINPVNNAVENASKHTAEAIVGVTRDLTTRDLVQLQLGYSAGRGYYSEPYKLFDNRPDHRRDETAALRWNHHLRSLNATLRGSYRYYHDSYGVSAHTLVADWVQPLHDTLASTTTLRYDTQSAASFYIDPVPNAPFPNIPDGAYSTLDQRLSAFGAVTVGEKLAWTPGGGHWAYDIRVDYSRQQSSLRLIGTGSPGLQPFEYYAVQVGIAYTY